MKTKVIIVVRTTKGSTTNGLYRRIVTVFNATTGHQIWGKIKGLRFSETQGGYITYGAWDENKHYFDAFDIEQTYWH